MTEKVETEQKLWDQAYQEASFPWQVIGSNDTRDRMLAEYSRGHRLLDVGCGTGENFAFIQSLGFEITGIDVSPIALEIASNRKDIGDAKLLTANFFSWSDTYLFDVVIDHGTFHNMKGPNEREAFANQVSANLDRNGIWLNISACADSPRTNLSHGGLYLQDFISIAEPYFEILEVIRKPYGLKNTKEDFQAWYSVLRRR